MLNNMPALPAVRSVAACSSSGGSSSTGGGSSPASTLAVGEFNPFTGPDAAFGPEMAAGCIPAIRLINAGGGVLGHQMSCVQEDTRGDPADAVKATAVDVPAVPVLYGAAWYEFSTANFTGWPTSENPFINPSPRSQDYEYLILKLTPKP